VFVVWVLFLSSIMWENIFFVDLCKLYSLHMWLGDYFRIGCIWYPYLSLRRQLKFGWSSTHSTHLVSRLQIPDLLDLGIVKGISKYSCNIESYLELSSNHSSVIITLESKVITRNRLCTFRNIKTDWSFFQKLLNNSQKIHPLKINDDIICAVKSFNYAIQ